MSFISEMENRNELVEAKFYNKNITSSSGQVTPSWPDNPDLTVQVLFWTGRAAERLVSEKYKAEVLGLINMDYEDYVVTVEEGAKVRINDKDYSVIYVDNVGGQNQLIQIPVRNFDGKRS